MSQPLLTVVAEFLAKPGSEEALQAALASVVEPTRAEDGCVQYDLHVATAEPGRFVFYENWTSREALMKHAGSEHIKALGGKVADLVVTPARVLTYTRIA